MIKRRVKICIETSSVTLFTTKVRSFLLQRVPAYCIVLDGGVAPQDYKPKVIGTERQNIVADKEPENEYDYDDN